MGNSLHSSLRMPRAECHRKVGPKGQVENSGETERKGCEMADHEVPIRRRILPTGIFKDGRSVSSEEGHEPSGTSYQLWTIQVVPFFLLSSFSGEQE